MADRRNVERQQSEYSNAKELMGKEGDFSINTLVLPEGTKLFRFRKTGLYRLDFMPFVAAEGNPEVRKGVKHYQRVYEIHRNLGADGNSSEVCLAKTFGEPCPRCEMIAEYRRQGTHDYDTLKELGPKLRKIYALVDLEEKDAGVQIFETAHYKSFGEMLKNKIDGSDDLGYENFFHLEDGLTLLVKVKDQSWTGGSFKGATNIEMAPRRKPYPPEFIKKVPCLDKLIKHRTYEELEEICHAGPKGKAKGNPFVDTTNYEPEEDDVVQFEYKGKDITGIVTKVVTSKKLAYVKVKGKEDAHVVDWEDLSLVDDTDDTVDDDDDTTVAPPKKGKTKAPPPDTDDEEEEDEDDDDDDQDDEGEDEDGDTEDEDDEPTPPKKGKKPAAPAEPPKKGKKPPVVEDDDDEEAEDQDDDWTDDGDDEPPAKPPVKKPKKK